MGNERLPKNQEAFSQQIGAVLLGGESAHMTRETGVRQALTLVQQDATIFARQMRDNRLPVDTAVHVIEEKVTIPRRFGKDRKETNRHTTRYPIWLVLDKKDLSGTDMEWALRFTESPAGKNKSEPLDPEKFGEAPFEDWYGDTYYTGQHHAIAVTAEGELVTVFRHRHKLSFSSYRDSIYSAWKIEPGKLAMPIEVFGEKGVIDGDLSEMVAEMQTQFASSAKKYLDKKLADTQNYAEYFYTPQQFYGEQNRWR